MKELRKKIGALMPIIFNSGRVLSADIYRSKGGKGVRSTRSNHGVGVGSDGIVANTEHCETIELIFTEQNRALGVPDDPNKTSGCV